MSKYLVTGGMGFIGSNLVKRLLDDGHYVSVIDDFSSGRWENLAPCLKNKNLRIHNQSILSNFPDEQVDVIFHLAAIPRVQKSIDDPRVTHLVNVDGTFNVLLRAREIGAKVIFSSSSSVYGNQKLPFTEEMKPNPISPYALHKLIGEQYCKLFSDIFGVKTVSLRYFNVYGKNMDPDSPYANLIPKFIKMIKNGESPTINGDGTQTRDMTSVDDVVEANILAANSDISGEVINIGGGRNYSVNEVAEMIKKSFMSNVEIKHGGAILEPHDTLADIKKAEELLGWMPKINLEDYLNKII